MGEKIIEKSLGEVFRLRVHYSFIAMAKHEVEMHEGRAVSFGAKVTHTNRDCMSRQVREGVSIRRSMHPVLNSKTEWFQPPIYKVVSEMMRE